VARRFTHHDRFIAEYCHTMLWASTEPEARLDEPGHVDPSGTCVGCNCEFSSRSRVMRAVPEPEPTADVPWPLAAFTEASQRSIEADCANFIRANWADLYGLDPGQAGYDFALSRNDSDLGFLRRDLGDRVTGCTWPQCPTGAAPRGRTGPGGAPARRASRGRRPAVAGRQEPGYLSGQGIELGDRDLEIEL